MNFEPTLFDHVLVLLFAVAMPLFVALKAHPQMKAVVFTTSERLSLYWSNGILLFLMGGLALAAWAYADRSWVDLGLNAPSAQSIGQSTLILAPFVVWLTIDIRRKSATPEARAKARRKSNLDTPFLPQNRKELTHCFFLCAAAGFGEEVFFRGFLIRYATHYFGTSVFGIGAAILLPALIFGLSHRYHGAKVIAQIILMSVLFGTAYIVSGNLWPLIVAHALVDVVMSTLAVKMYQEYGTDGEPLAVPS